MKNSSKKAYNSDNKKWIGEKKVGKQIPIVFCITDKAQPEAEKLAFYYLPFYFSASSSQIRSRLRAMWKGSLTGSATTFSCGRPSRVRI